MSRTPLQLNKQDNMDYENKVDHAIQWLLIAENTDYIGEPVSQLEHALQCAYFAEQAGYDDDVVLASLFHDIGHFASNTLQFKMAELGTVNHEWIGAKLAFDLGFSAKVALLIGYHVDAKRYLASKKPNYYDRLSSASKQTLAFQGGPMSKVEIDNFEKHPHFKEILQVRINDEKAKEMALKVPDVNYYRDKASNHFIQNENTVLNNHAALTNYIDKDWVENFKSFLEKVIVCKG